MSISLLRKSGKLIGLIRIIRIKAE